MPPFVLGDIIGGRTPAPRYQLNPSPQTLGRGFKAPRRPFSASNWPLPIVNRPRGAMNFEVIFTASGPLAGAGARPGRLYPSTCASKPASASAVAMSSAAIMVLWLTQALRSGRLTSAWWMQGRSCSTNITESAASWSVRLGM